MKVVDYKLSEMQVRMEMGMLTGRGVTFENKNILESQLMLQRQETILSEKLKNQMRASSPFSKIEEQKQIVQDSKYMVPVLINNIDTAMGNKPCSRKYFGCCHANGRFYIMGGSANTLLNDMKSFSLGNQQWQLEGKT